ncbi:MAG: DUF5995 family protein [Myxococcota bacterium]|nr:DUF5995 family protein [Myxococcota bacterium]
MKTIYAILGGTLLVLSGCGELDDGDIRHSVNQKSQTIAAQRGDAEPCHGQLDHFAVQDVIELSDPETLVDEYDAQSRINAIAKLFREAEDPRGLFATVYRLITNRAIESVDAGAYEYNDWARDLITEFARRYLANLHAHFTDKPITGQWKKYYTLAQHCDVGRGRTLGVAIAVHLMVDLPKTLWSIGSMPEQREDFIVFGDILLEIFPDLITDVERDYRTDVRDFLQGFFFGKWVDRFTKVGTMTEFMYQGVRMKAWRDSQNYRRFPKAVVDLEVRSAWGAAEVLLAHLDAVVAL